MGELSSMLLLFLCTRSNPKLTAKQGSPETTSYKSRLGVRAWRPDCVVYCTLSFILPKWLSSPFRSNLKTVTCPF